MFQDRLDIVNACLATMGESGINTLEDDHPYKDDALRRLEQCNLIEQKRGWWFNSEYIELLPDSVSKFIYIPMDALAVKRPDRSALHFAQRGNRLYNMWENNYEWETSVVVDLVRTIEFEDLPFHANDLVGFSTVLRFQTDFDGDQVRYGQIAKDYARARMELVAEDTRNTRPNLLATLSNRVNMGHIGGMGTRGARIPYTPGWPR
jgi:hypothetical protein